MSDKSQRLNEILDTFAPEGANDRRWFFIEHQLEQAVVSAQSVVGFLKSIERWPENAEERELAKDCLQFAQAMLLDILSTKASFLGYLSDTSVPERISRKEL